LIVVSRPQKAGGKKSAAPGWPLLFLALLLGLTSCDPAGKKTPHQSDSLNCSQLDTLMQSLDAFQLLVMDAGWEEMQPSLDQLTHHLRNNIERRNDTCSFFNMQYYPDADRFGFIELLKERITEDSIPQGILYLIRLRGIFCVDKEITEFMSEEMAHVAVDNPSVFLKYYQDNPGQQELLLHSTRWNNVNTDSLIARFSRLEGGSPIADYLRGWKQRRMVLPDL
jgi:hypothetical protein